MKLDFWLKYAGYVLCFLIVSLLGYQYMNNPGAESINIITDKISQEKVNVTITGEVNEPGVYSVEKGVTVHDCIYLAGGITKEADPSTVDVDMVVCEPCTIEVGKDYDYDLQGYITTGEYTSDNPCNINTASQSELATLPAIGDVLASRIINHRETRGDFKKKEHICQVDGIGEGKYEQIKDLITVGGKE